MISREPNALPRGVDNWEDWRAAYEAHRADFIAWKIGSVSYVALLTMLGFTGDDLQRELQEAIEERRKNE